MARRPVLGVAAGLVVATALLACGPPAPPSRGASPGAPTDPTTAAPSPPRCDRASLVTEVPGTLTWATSEPAYEPWVVGDDPAGGAGFEAAVAAAVTGALGFAPGETAWVRQPFDDLVTAGPKLFDIAIDQVLITPERGTAVDLSSPYYDVHLAVVALEADPAAAAADLRGLRSRTLGSVAGTSGPAAIDALVTPEVKALEFESLNEAKLALLGREVEAIVVDLPTAYYLTTVEIPDATIVGALPRTGDASESFGLVLELHSPLTACVSAAVESLRREGTLDDLEARWLTGASAPLLH